VLKTGRVRARRYDLLGHLAPIVEQVISSLKWDSSQAGRPRGVARAARPRSGLRRNAPYSDRKRGISSCERFRSRLKQTFAEKIPLAMRKDVARHIEPDRIEPKALHP
jgi:hypothetical protein